MKKHFKSLLILPFAISLVNCGNSQNQNSNYISYKDYVEIVKNATEDQKDIFVFSLSNCIHCQKIKPLLLKYMAANDDDNLNIYELSLDFRMKINNEYVFRDETMGYLSGDSTNDCIKALDNRITMYVNEFDVVSSANSELNPIIGDERYSYISTPLLLFYVGGKEVRIVNNIEYLLEFDKKGNVTYESFENAMQFPDNYQQWDKEFDLTYYSKKG